LSVLIKSESEIGNFLRTDEFVQATIAQTNKDLTGVSERILVFDVTATNQLDSLCHQLKQILVAMQNPERIAQFIYRVDLAENDFRKALNDENWHDLAFLVIRREAQKVFLRHHFMT
jgi:hypothetical protein